MIIIDDVMFPTIESLNNLIESMKKNAYKEEYFYITEIYHSYLLDCYDADCRLQEMVIDNLGEKFTSFSILPIQDTEDLMSFSFTLTHEDNREIKKREEIIFKDLCDICFGGIKPFYVRLMERYDV